MDVVRPRVHRVSHPTSDAAVFRDRQPGERSHRIVEHEPGIGQPLTIMLLPAAMGRKQGSSPLVATLGN